MVGRLPSPTKRNTNTCLTFSAIIWVGHHCSESLGHHCSESVGTHLCSVLICQLVYRRVCKCGDFVMADQDDVDQNKPGYVTCRGPLGFLPVIKSRVCSTFNNIGCCHSLYYSIHCPLHATIVVYLYWGIPLFKHTPPSDFSTSLGQKLVYS